RALRRCRRMSPSGSRMHTDGTATVFSFFWRLASRSSAAGTNTDAAFADLLRRIGHAGGFGPVARRAMFTKSDASARSADRVEDAPEETLPVAHGGRVAAQPGVE